MYGASLGLKSLGRVPLGGERFVTYGTMPYVTLGRRSKRIHLHGLDPATSAFFAANYGTTPNITTLERRIIRCIDQLVKELKSDGFWDICSVIYPFAGYGKVGSDWNDSLNLKDPRFTSAAFRLSYGGNDAVHNQYGTTLGVSPNSSDTQFNPGTALGTNNWHICCYLNTANGTGSATMCMASCNATGGINFTLFNDATKTLRLVGNGVTLDAVISCRKGCMIGTRTSSTSMSIYRGGELVANSTTAVVNSLPSRTEKLMFQESGTTNYCTVPFNFCSMGSSLTDDQAFRMSQIVQDYQTRMGRAV